MHISNYYISQPAVTMLKEPNDCSEMVSEAFYSEEVSILEERFLWMRVSTKVDEYSGWMHIQNSKPLPYSFLDQKIVKINRLSAHVFQTNNMKMKPLLTLPYGSKLTVLEDQEGLKNKGWVRVQLVDKRIGCVQTGCITYDETPLSVKQAVELAKTFLGVPYTWGGRSSFGLDCSGFTQLLYREMGYQIPRDAKDQYNWKGFTAASWDHLLPGDLLFLGLSKEKISHVAMYMGDNTLIHASSAETHPYILTARIDCEEVRRAPFKEAKRLQLENNAIYQK